MKPVSIVFGLRVDVSVVFAEKIYYVIVSFVAGVVQRSPVVGALVIDLYRIAVLTMLNQFLNLIIEAFFTVKSQLLIILLNIQPKVLPVELKVMNICKYKNKYHACLQITSYQGYPLTTSLLSILPLLYLDFLF